MGSNQPSLVCHNPPNLLGGYLRSSHSLGGGGERCGLGSDCTPWKWTPLAQFVLPPQGPWLYFEDALCHLLPCHIREGQWDSASAGDQAAFSVCSLSLEVWRTHAHFPFWIIKRSFGPCCRLLKTQPSDTAVFSLFSGRGSEYFWTITVDIEMELLLFT